jgi:hypothetical protein
VNKPINLHYFYSSIHIFFIFSTFFYFSVFLFFGLGPAQPTWAGLGPASPAWSLAQAVTRLGKGMQHACVQKLIKSKLHSNFTMKNGRERNENKLT